MTNRRQLRQAKHQATRQENIRRKSQQWHLEMQTAITRFQTAQKARLDRWKALFPVFLPLNLSRLPSYLQAFVGLVGKLISRGQTIRNKLTAAADAVGDRLVAAAKSVGGTRRSRRTRQLRAGHLNFGQKRSKKSKPSNRAKLATLRAGIEALEPRQVLAGNVYVNDNWVIDMDTNANMILDAGDTVKNTGAGDDGSLVGLIYGTDAFDTFASAQAALMSGGTINVVGGTYNENLPIASGNDVLLIGAVNLNGDLSSAFPSTNLNLDLYNLTLNSSADTSFAGSLSSGAGSNFIKTGAGKFTAESAALSFTGSVTINGGTFSIKNSTAIGNTSSNAVTVNSTGAFEIDNVSFLRNINLNDGSKLIGKGNASTNYGSPVLSQPHITIANSATVTLATAGSGDKLTIGSNVNRLQGGTNSTINVIGAGTVELTQNNNANLAAKWDVDASTLQIAGDLNLGVIPGGATADAITLRNGGTLVSTTTTIAANRGITLAGTGGVLSATSTNVLSVASAIAGAAPLTTNSGSGAILLSNTGNNYSGSTTISTGTLRLGAAGVIPNASDVAINLVAVLDLNGFSETIDGLTGAGTVNATSGTPTLTVGSADAMAVFSGNIAGGGGTVNLQKIGSGTQSLNGTAATGTTTIDGGATGRSPRQAEWLSTTRGHWPAR